MRKVGTKSRCKYCNKSITWVMIEDWLSDEDSRFVCDVARKLNNELDHIPMIFNDYINLIKL